MSNKTEGCEKEGVKRVKGEGGKGKKGVKKVEGKGILSVESIRGLSTVDGSSQTF